MSLVSRRNRKPRCGFTEARVLHAVPLHGGAFPVTAFFPRPASLTDGSFYIFFSRRRSRLHSDLFAVVHDGSPAQSQVERSHHFGNLIIVLPVAISIVGAHDIVVADYINRPASGAIDPCDMFTKHGCRKLQF